MINTNCYRNKYSKGGKSRKWLISINCYRNEQILTSWGCKIQNINPVCQECHQRSNFCYIFFWLVHNGCMKSKNTVMVLSFCHVLQHSTWESGVVSAWRKYAVLFVYLNSVFILNACWRFGLQIIFALVMLFRNSSSFHISIATRIFSLSVSVIFSYF